MIQKTIQLFTEKEEEFLGLLIKIGTQKNIAKLLVFLANTREATTREIEHGTDLRQPEVSVAVKSLARLGWIKSWEVPSERRARPNKKYSLAIPVTAIMDHIVRQKQKEVNNQLALIRKARGFA
jgi:predicted transcriptional regulator